MAAEVAQSSAGGLAFDEVYLSEQHASSASLACQVGRLKLSAAGLAWKDSKTGRIVTLASGDVLRVQWLRAMRQYELRFYLSNEKGMVQLDNLSSDAFGGLEDFISTHWGLLVERRAQACKGRNWGRVVVGGDGRMEFLDEEGQLQFDVVLGDVLNVTNPQKDELALELVDTSIAHVSDCVTELRFSVPNAAFSDVATAGEEEEVEEVQDEKEETQAQKMCSTIKGFSQSTKGVGTVLAALPAELSCILPRGKFGVDFSATHLRLRGKSYDHRIPFMSIVKTFLLPRSDETHLLVVLQLDPPMRQGQTRYPFMIFQMHRDDQLALDVNKPAGTKMMEALQDRYEGAAYEVFTLLLKHLAGQKVIVPGSGSFSSLVDGGSSAVRCIFKADEGFLYCLDRSLIFLPKPVILMPHAEIASVEIARAGVGLGGNPRSFDIKIILKRPLAPSHCSLASMGSGSGGNQQILLSSIAKEELVALQEYFGLKQIDMRSVDEAGNAMGRRSANATVAAALDSDSEADGDDASSTDEDYNDEDDEEDGDFSDGDDDEEEDDEDDDGEEEDEEFSDEDD